MAYSIDRMPERISIGRETETGVTDVMIDCSAWVMKWPGMALHAIYTPEGGAPYILQTETDGSVLVWHVTDADTATPGTGLVEIVGEMDGRRKVSATVKVSVAARMGGTVGEPPEAAKPWADRVVEAAERITGMQVQAETLAAGISATAAWDGEHGLLTIGVPKGEKGEKGPQGEKGEPGKDAVVDATLTQSGQAADAKVTGDTFIQLKGDLSNLTDSIPDIIKSTTKDEYKSKNLFENKNLSAGRLTSATTQDTSGSYVTTDYIPISKGSYVIQVVSDNYVRICYATYKADKTQIDYKNINNINSVSFVIEQDGYVRFSTFSDDSIKFAMLISGSEPLEEFVPYYNPYSFVKKEYAPSNILHGKKWAVCGDSFSYGAYAKSDLKQITDGKYKGKPFTYGYIIANRNNMEIQNLSLSGRTMATPSTDHTNTCFSDGIYQTIDEDVDYITIYLGINDSHHAPNGSSGDGEDNTGVIPVGTIDDTTVNTFYGAWNVVLDWLIKNRPFAHIGIIVTNGCGSETYRIAEIEIAKKYGIPYIDLNGDGRTPAMIRADNSEIDAGIISARNRAMAVDYDGSKYGEGVNLHPNEKAHEYESCFIENFLRSI